MSIHPQPNDKPRKQQEWGIFQHTSSLFPSGSSTNTITSPCPALMVSTVNLAGCFTMFPVGSIPVTSWHSSLFTEQGCGATITSRIPFGTEIPCRRQGHGQLPQHQQSDSCKALILSKLFKQHPSHKILSAVLKEAILHDSAQLYLAAEHTWRQVPCELKDSFSLRPLSESLKFLQITFSYHLFN